MNMKHRIFRTSATGQTQLMHEASAESTIAWLVGQLNDAAEAGLIGVTGEIWSYVPPSRTGEALDSRAGSKP